MAAGFRPYQARQPVRGANARIGRKKLQQVEKAKGECRDQPLPEVVQFQDDPRQK